jgi:uncharacterized membrane protein (DUF485 family)
MNAKTSTGSAAKAEMSQWDRVAGMDEFRQLLKVKVSFVVPATIFFIAYYFALPVLVGYFPAYMDRKVWGPVNIAYLFALSQFFMAWIICYLYVRVARKFDEYGARIMKRLDEEGKKVEG